MKHGDIIEVADKGRFRAVGSNAESGVNDSDCHGCAGDKDAPLCWRLPCCSSTGDNNDGQSFIFMRAE